MVSRRKVPYSEIKKGYEIQKDNYIVLEKEELNKVKLKTTHSIEIKEFIEYKDLDPILINNSYYVASDAKKGNEEAYALLVKILNDNNLMAIGKVILKHRENVIALRPYKRGLVMHVLNYLDDMKPVDEIPEMGNTKAKLDPKEVSLGKILVQKYRSKQFDIGDYSDSYVKELRKLIDAKIKGKKFISTAPKEAKPTKDLLEALKVSIETKKK
jgi:DNA end-binding protein Ku